MSAELAPTTWSSTTAWVDLVAPAADLATQIADTEFVPTALRKRPAAVAACILFGAELGIGPLQSLSKVDMVEGRPAPKAELARALALSAGHDVWVEEATNTRVVVAGRRRGTETIQRVAWTMDDAKRAGLDGRPNYKKYPRQMLLARASAELVRMAFPDVLGGIAYFAEELDGDLPTTEPVAVTTEPPIGTKRRKLPTQAVEAAPLEVEQPALPAASHEPVVGPDGMTHDQRSKLMVLAKEAGLDDRVDRLAVAAAVIGRPLDTANQLTKDETSKLIDALTQIVTGTLRVAWQDDGSALVVPHDEPAAQEPPL